MGSPSYDISNKPLGSIAAFTSIFDASKQAGRESNEAQAGEGFLARQLTPKDKGTKYEAGQINVVKDYPWTLSKVDSSTIPYVRLIEYYTNESMVKKALQAFGAQAVDTLRNIIPGTSPAGKQAGTLGVYNEIFDKSDPTDFSYWLPYFNKTSFELSTPNWQAIDGIGESIKKVAGAIPGADQIVGPLVDFAKAASTASLAVQYAGVGIFDRPRLFAGHNERQVTVSFPLYNTKNAGDWTKNRDLIYLLMSQNQYNKRDYITGIPPVFYDVYIPGQYYCYAASITNIQVENLGNVRMIDNEFIVPDAYQINLTLSEMTMPSKNQFEAVTNGQARSFVNSWEVAASGKTNQQVTAENAQNAATYKPNSVIQTAVKVLNSIGG